MGIPGEGIDWQGPFNARLGAVPARSLIEVLLEVADRHPDLVLREELDGRAMGVWSIEDLVEAVRRDVAAMTPAERAEAEFHRWFWGYGPEMTVQIVHSPVRGPSAVRFIQV